LSKEDLKEIKIQFYYDLTFKELFEVIKGLVDEKMIQSTYAVTSVFRKYFILIEGVFLDK